MTSTPNTPTLSPDNNGTRKHVWRWLQIVAVVVALVYAYRQLSGKWAELGTAASNLHPNWLLLVSASAAVLATYGMLAQSWRILVVAFGGALSYASAMRIYFASKLGLYLPGKVWAIVGMGIMAEKVGVAPAAAAGSAIIGTLLNIGAGFGVVALSGSRVASGLPDSVQRAPLIGAVLFALGVLAAPVLLPMVTRFIAKRFKREMPDIALPASTLWGAVTLNVLSWFGYGWAFMLFSKALLPGLGGSLPQFVAVWSASYLFGYIVLFAPGGIGFREIAMTGLLVKLGLANTSEAALLSVASRVWLIVLELLPGIIGLLLGTRRDRESARPA